MDRITAVPRRLTLQRGFTLTEMAVVLFIIGPFYVFFLQQRLPHGIMKEGWRPWVSAMGTNIALVAILGAVIWMGGLSMLLLVWLPTMMLAAMIVRFVCVPPTRKCTSLSAPPSLA